MKLLRFASLLLILTLAACGGSPGSTAKEFYLEVGSGQLEKAKEKLDPAETAMMGTAKTTASLEDQTRKMQKKGGLKTVEIVKETVNGEVATVTLKADYSDGSTTTENIQVHKVGGRWILHMR